MTEVACGNCSRGQTIASIGKTSFDVAECEYRPDQRFPQHQHDRAGFCLVLDGGYEEHNGASTVRCESAALVFHLAGATQHRFRSVLTGR
jgi:anti-sigma factor ChrR (cupin superfamily)